MNDHLPTCGLPTSNTPPGAPYGRGADRVLCVRCGAPVEAARRCYAHPTCYACLPPPEPLPVRLTPEVIADRLARGRVNADALEEQLVRLTPRRALDLVLGGQTTNGGHDHAAPMDRKAPTNTQDVATEVDAHHSPETGSRRDSRERPAFTTSER